MDPSSSSGFGVLGFMDPEEDNTNAIAFDFFFKPDSMPPPSNAAGGMEFFAQSQVHSSLVGHGNNFMVDLDLNSEAPDYPHLSTYQYIIQAEQMMPPTMDMIDGHIASDSGTGGRQSGKSEYGAGNMVSTHGDVYSYGILVLELVTGKRPTDGSSTQGLSLREYVELGLHGSGSRVLDVVDTQLSLGRVDELQTDCVVSLLRLGVSCSHEMPSSRMATGDVVRELRGINEFLVQGLAS